MVALVVAATACVGSWNPRDTRNKCDVLECFEALRSFLEICVVLLE